MKEKYRELCKTEVSIPIFSQDWWLDVTAGKDNWDVAVVLKNNEIIASLPYVLRKNKSLTFLEQPPLTQNLGPWIKPSDTKYSKKLSNEKDYLQSLIDSLPTFDHYEQNWHHSQTNWLPFYWKGFSQTTNFTYTLSQIDNHDLLWKNMQDNIKSDCKKAATRFQLIVDPNPTLEEFLILNEMTFKKQGLPLPYSEEFIRKVNEACKENSCRQIIIVRDPEGKAHAGAYIIWDKMSAYYLMGGINPDLKTSGAMSMCLWETIKFASTFTTNFDFEGSMIEPIERFFRGFGAIQTPYNRVFKTPSRIVKIKKFLSSL